MGTEALLADEELLDGLDDEDLLDRVPASPPGPVMPSPATHVILKELKAGERLRKRIAGNWIDNHFVASRTFWRQNTVWDTFGHRLQ